MLKPTPIVVAIALTLVLGLHLPSRVDARATVEGRELVSRTRVGRTQYLYTYRLTLNNDGPSLDNVNVWALCDAPGTTMVDEIAEFGDVDADTVVQSTGTFSFRQNRRIPFDPGCLTYEIGFETPLIISGTATDMPLSGATIIGTVNHPESGRPIVDTGLEPVDTFTTTADANGNFTLEMEAKMQEDFVTIDAIGVGDQDEAALTNTLGSVGALHDAGDDGSIIINPGNFGSDITHITTALAVLAEIANGGPIMSDGELAAAQAQVIGTELLEMAALIKAVIDNPNVPLPPGVDNTLDMVSDPELFAAYLQEVRTLFPDEFNAAILETAENIQSGYDPTDVPGVLYAAQRDEQPLTGPAFDARPTFVFDLDANGGGSVVLFNGSSEVNWVVDADGEIIIEVLDPSVVVGFFTCNVPGIPNSLCRFITTVERIRLIRLAQGLMSDQVIVLRTIRRTFPDSPGMADEVIEDQPGPDNVYLTFGPDGILPVDIEDLAGNQIAIYYYHQDNDTTSLIDTDYGIDFLFFNADGTGVTTRRGFAFAWAVDADGIVTILFDNGDTTRYFRYSNDGEISQAVAVGVLANGTTKTSNSEAIEYDGVSEFAESMLLNRRFRPLFSVIDQEVVFDFLFLPGGDGCVISDFGFGEDIRRFIWGSAPDNEMDLFQFARSDPSLAVLRRAWEAITVLPGILGDRYWVIELLDVNDFQDPNFELADPVVTPGRLNAYEFIEDLTGQVNPCGF